MPIRLDAPAEDSVPILPVTPETLAARLPSLDRSARAWLATHRFNAARHAHCMLPTPDGRLDAVLVGVRPHDPFALSALPGVLPAGRYVVRDEGLVPTEAQVLSWSLGEYRYSRYRAHPTPSATLILPPGEAVARAQQLVAAIVLTRDLVNTPTEDMGPADLAACARGVAEAQGGQVREWVGDDLLRDNFPAIHAVGRASHRPPRLIEITWGDARHPRLAIVGKGVCFDTGGLDMKNADGMRLMKKDMGGAAHALALAQLVMARRLPVRLQVLVPAVENAIAGNAYRPGEVVATRKGHRVEIHNTDAEGRVILCDALAYAAEQSPDLIIDFATLTGAARVALGPELPALFCNRDALAQALAEKAELLADPLWRMPLYRSYRRLFESDIADFSNASKTTFAGAITAALFLDYFVPEEIAWCHVDLFAWNDIARPGRPAGGEAQTLRTFISVLEDRYGVFER
jgi:leucyl aminopeptidase